MSTSSCPGCGAPVGDSAPSAHPYLGASVECWELFGMLQTLEMERYGYPDVHRLVVDAYAAQHPGPGIERRDRQSVFVHLASIHLVVDEGRTSAEAGALLRRLTHGRPEFPLLQRSDTGAIDLRHAWEAPDLEDYERRVREWAAAVWASYEPSHDVICCAIREAYAGGSGSSGISDRASRPSKVVSPVSAPPGS